jgi:hypothetical protein
MAAARPAFAARHRRPSSEHEALVVPALTIGCEHTFIHQVADFVQGLAGDKPASASFRDAMATDFVTDAALPSAQLGRWEKVQS